jgi:hypothetical protein
MFPSVRRGCSNLPPPFKALRPKGKTRSDEQMGLSGV